MTRIHIPPENMQSSSVLLKGEEFRHLIQVLKMDLGEEVALLDGRCREYLGKISTIGKDFVKIDIISELNLDTEPKVKVTLYHSLLKGEKYEWLIHKAVELGVAGIIPVVSGRSILREVSRTKLKRWRQVAVSAACVARRGLIPEVASPVFLKAALDSLPPGEPALLFWECATGNIRIWDFKEALASLKGETSFHLFVGPEGGFTMEEVKLAVAAGARVVNLGPRTFKSETAGIAALSLVLFEMGEMSPKKEGFSCETGK
ncbi:MAG: RsmE family RNA methyltransferase [bacterium]